MSQFESLRDIMAKEEARLLAEAKKEIAAEKAAWDAMTPEAQANARAVIEAKYPNVEADDDCCNDDDDEEEA